MADNVIVCIPGIPPLTWGGSQEARPKCEDDKPIGLWASQGRINKFSFPKEPSQWKERKIAIEDDNEHNQVFNTDESRTGK
jgi:hypothetical protein